MRFRLLSGIGFGVSAAFACLFGLRAVNAQEVKSVQSVRPAARAVSLEPMTSEESHAQSLLKSELVRSTAPENFREMGVVQTNQVADTKRLTLRFAASARLTKIEDTPDFKVEQGGSCAEGHAYEANSTCTLLVRFTPQGPGRRTGKVAITNSVDATPMLVGLGGYGSAPAISFMPAIISTISQTGTTARGILSGATNLAVDGGDGVYIADTGNKLIRYYNPSGTIQSIPTFFTATDPQGIAVDAFDTVYFSQDNPATFSFTTNHGTATQYSSGSTFCAYGTTCSFSGAPLNYPGALALDPNGNIFMSVYNEAYELFYTSNSLNYIPLTDYYNYNNTIPTGPGPIAVDASDNIYAYQNYLGNCFISSNNGYYAGAGDYTHLRVVAGNRGCGFGGDGGPARSALIGGQIGQMTFDIAGNFYFADKTNQRVRRIDVSTGVITTIAGNGVVGSSGDGGPATSAHLSSPTGVTVDSQGQVYILSSATSGQILRRVGTVGALDLGGLAVGTSSTAQTVTVANTGNAPLNYLHVGFSSGNTGDFSMDVNTTTCNFTVPLAAGKNCKIGFIFKPAAAGARSAVLTMTDDTVAGVNTIQVSGTGLTTATLTPSSITVPNVTVGSTGATQKATLTNTGKATLTISSIVLSGAGASSYTKTTTCGTTLAAAASCTISISFKPVSSGKHTATLTVADNAVGGQQTVALTGTGVTAAAKAATVTLLSSASNPAMMYGSLVLTAKVSADGAELPTGRAQLWEGARMWSESALTGGVAKYSLSGLTSGMHVMKAIYLGDDRSLASASAPIKQLVASPSSGPVPRR